MKHESAQGAIAEAMNDYLNNGTFTPHNPAICRDRAGWYYGSALHGEAVYELDGGFGDWTPASVEEIEAAANGLAAEIAMDN